MALALNDRVQQTGTANTTVSFTLSGSVTGFQSFAVVGNGNTTYYSSTDASGNWEVGIGIYSTTGPTLTRTTILSSSNSGSAVTFSGTVNVFVTYPSSKSINYDANGVATIGTTLGYSDTGIIGSFASTVAGYNQVIVQNKSTATNASSNLNVSNDASTSSAGYAELGINSSTFSGTGSFNIAGAAYVASASTDLTIGTYGAYNVHFVTNSNTTDAMTIFNSGGVSLGGYADPGIGTLYANNVYLGFNTITAAAGTTILTNASAAWQNVVGTTTQTIRMPNATTLYKGLAFTITSSSTGNVTVTDNASTTLDTVVTGGSAIMVLTDNSTSAGTWKAYSYIPASYDFSTSTANFGGATITNALWNGTTIGTGYGGTGLTTFSAANNAIYSTSSSALAAGTLPIAAGGTAATTFTANGILYGNGTSALGVTAAGTTGQVLIGNTGSSPTWGSLSGSAVTTFQTSLSGLTPSTATSGAVTLAGTLGATSGGTGLTSYTTGDIVYASATNTLSKLAAGTNGYILTLASGIPSWAANSATGASFNVTDFTATASQTTFTVTYTVGLVEVYRNGVKLAIADYTASNGTTIVLATGANSGDIIEVVAFSAVNTAATISYDTFSGTGSQTAFTMSVTPANSQSVVVAISGVVQDPVNYTVSGTTLTFSTAPPLGTNNISCRYLGLPTTTTGTASVVNATNGIIVNNSQIAASYTIPSGSNALSVGPVTAGSGAVITVPSGSRYIVL